MSFQTYSNGCPVAVVEKLLRIWQEDLDKDAAEGLAREIIGTIPNFVDEPAEWIWSGRIEWNGSEEARAILLQAAKPRRKWRHRIRLPLEAG